MLQATYRKIFDRLPEGVFVFDDKYRVKFTNAAFRRAFSAAAKKGDSMNQEKSRVKRYLREFWKYRDLLKLLVEKNIKLKYRRSWLGYVWSILNPLLIMIVMSVVFSTMFRRNIDNFPVYLFCGQLLFNYMNSSTSQSVFSITGNAALLKKTYLPKYMFTLARVTSGLVDLVFSLGALVIVLIATRVPITWNILLFPVVLLQLFAYFTAKEKGCDIDKPRNLAKSVTVE